MKRILSRTAPFKVALVFVIAVVCSLAIFGARRWISNAASNPIVTSDKSPTTVEIVTLRPDGFEPAELSLPADPVVLSIHNRSGLEEVDLRLEVEAGPRFKEIRVPRKRLDIKEVVDLRPGRYRLTEANNPAWSCVITVAAQ